MEEWDSLRASFIFDEIQSFAEKVAAAGREGGLDPLSDWAEKLRRQASSFDMERLPASLEEFPVLIREIKQWSRA